MTSFDEKILSIVKGFNSTIPKNVFKDKWVSIVGDGISTYKGWVPEDNTAFYPYKDVDVKNVNEMWWHILITKLEAKLCVNNSYSGVMIANSEPEIITKFIDNLYIDAGQEYKKMDGTTEIATNRINPDIILVFLGNNEFENDVPVGEANLNGTPSEENTSFSQCIETILYRLIELYPMAKIYCINNLARFEKYPFLQKNAAGSSIADYRLALEKICKAMEVNVLHADKLGIHSYNAQRYLVFRKFPKIITHKMLAEQCYNEMSNCVNCLYE